MSRSRIGGERFHSRSKSFLNAPIEFRRVVHHRRGHQAISGYPQASQISRNRQLLPSQSHLERLIHPGGESSGTRRGLNKQLSLSHSQASRLHNHTPNSQIITPKNFQSNQIPSRTDSRLRDHTSLKNFINPRHSEPQQQKTPIRQQRVHTEVSAQQINQKLNKLVHCKLKTIFESFQKRGKARGEFEAQKQQINRQLQKLIQEIKSLRGFGGGQMDLYNQKITFIETLLAEQSTQAELMKKHYFQLSSNKKKGGNFQLFNSKVSAAYQSLSIYQNQSKQYRSVGSPLGSGKKPLFKETTNKSSYKQPRKSDYQSYRYQYRASPPNLQPLPRSSYKRDFQILPSNQDEKIINRDHSPYNPQLKQRVGSIYGQDYRVVHTEMVDPKSQDACKDKIKTINVSYIPKKKQLPPPLEAPPIRRKPLPSPNFASEQELNHRKRTLLSESKREYTGLKTFQPSQIKHRQLHEFQYKLKNLFKA